MTGCKREHIMDALACNEHLTRAQQLAEANDLWCALCGPRGSRERVRLRVIPLADERANR